MRTALCFCVLAAMGCSSTTNSTDASGIDAPAPDTAPMDAPRADLSSGDALLTLDAATDARVDGMPDAARPDAGCVRALPGEFRVGRDGGKVAYVDVITLSPPARFALQRTSGATVRAMCETEIPACVAPDMVDVGTVASALIDPEVTALLNRHDALVGYDSRPVDGTVFAIRRGADTLLVGSSCRDSMGTSCVPVPAGVQRAVDILSALVEQERQRPVCRTALGM